MPEAARLLGRDRVDDPLEAARALLALGPGAVLLKGGRGEGDELVDVLVTRESPLPFRFPHPRIAANTHGTGCSLSAAIAAGLARGLALPAATEAAIAWLQGALAHAWPLGLGSGPVHHFWEWWA